VTRTRFAALGALALAGALALTGCSAGSNAASDGGTKSIGTPDGTGKTITVWMMNGDLSDKVLDAAGKQFTADTGIKGDLAQDVDYTAISGADAYPIPLVSYGILCTTFKDAKQKELATAYLGWIGSDIGQQVAAKNAGAAQIPEKLLTEIAASLALVK
jgi:ABC-type glycerol-3-phosphate transport system substrate-binding protein